MIDRNTSSSALAIVAVCFILAAAIVAAGRQPAPAELQPRIIPPVLYLPTAAPAPTPDMQLQQELAQLRARVAELEAERQAPVRNVEAQPPAAPNADTYQVTNAAPQPAAPAPTAWTANPQIQHNADGSTVSTFDPPADAPRYCKSFGGDANDWRAFDAMYSQSPACEK